MDTGQKLNRYMANLSEGLTREVTYPVGFNDLSYFTRDSSSSSASARVTTTRAQDRHSEWQDCPNALCLEGDRLRMKVRAGGFTYVLLHDLPPEMTQMTPQCS